MNNLQTMRNVLRLRLEDKDFKISPLFLTDIIEMAELELAILLSPELLTSLETIESVAISGSSFNLSSLEYQPLKAGNSILKVKMANGLYAHQIDINNLKQTEIDLLEGTDGTPQYYIYDGKVNFLCDTASQTVTIYYHKKPLPLTPIFVLATASTFSDAATVPTPSGVDDAYNNKAIYNIDTKSYHIITDYVGTSKTLTLSPTMTGAATGDRIIFVDDEVKASLGTFVQTSLNNDYNDIILLLAEGNAWKKDGYSDRSKEAIAKAYARIKELNKGDE